MFVKAFSHAAVAVLGFYSSGAGAAAPVDPRIARYQPRAVAPAAAADYLAGDGAVNIIGYNDMQGMITALNGLFAETHPGIRFALTLRGTRTGPPALAAGATAFAPMGAEFSEPELAAYRQRVGAAPLLIRVAHASLDPRALSAPLALLVHRDNPLAQIALDDAARAFTTRGGGDAIVRWGQLGLTGEWAQRPVHLCGLGPAYALAARMQKQHFGGAPFAAGLAGFPQSSGAIECVAGDPLALGFAAINRATPQVRALAVAPRAGMQAIQASAASVMAGQYPLDRHLYIAVRRLPGQTLDSFVREYLRLVLSYEGQQLIAADPLGYLPLNAEEAGQELSRLD
jgi:phosphate transport system substrate-binding protein